MDDGYNEIPTGYRRSAVVATQGRPVRRLAHLHCHHYVDKPFPDQGRTWRIYYHFLKSQYSAKPLNDWTDSGHPVNSDHFNYLSNSYMDSLSSIGVTQQAPPFITRAPFSLVADERLLSNTRLFRSDTGVDMSQEAAITRFLNLPFLARRIFQFLTYTDLISLGMTRAVNYKIIGKSMSCWDVSNADFGLCNLSDEQADIAILNQRFHPETIKARGCRTEVMATTSRTVNKQSQTDTFKNVVQLLRATHNFQHNIQVLHLHRIPFVDMRIIGSILHAGNLPKLQEFGVFNCELIHYGNSLELLDMIRQRELHGARRLDFFDFFPRYHEGPDDINREGSFGVSWNDSGVDTNAAIFSWLLFHTIPRCAVLGFDMLGTNTSFRRWLEKLPLEDWALPRILSLGCPPPSNTLELNKLYPPFVDMPGQGNTGEYLVDLFNILMHSRPEPIARNAWGLNHMCAWCYEFFPGFLMSTAQTSMCGGCAIKSHLTHEKDHYKQHKLSVIDAWIGMSQGASGEGKPNLGDLGNFTCAMSQVRFEHAARLANEIDTMLNLAIKANCIPSDPEHNAWRIAHRQHIVDTRDSFYLSACLWPDLGTGDLLQYCPQTEIDEWKKKAGDWDAKHMREKPNRSVNSREGDDESDD
ncbi:hypothetical protein CMQ_4446 [Grosmannia clavigera kw1407]|uniref:Uncharacterized protein n=1 Tax=Grosmannia clavigera (strain kw1407 / UAMH 11150) TaxID=655863 RepID=F0XU74_GROCL|nr:uncharacterized protein CMQ_4446 [Grosmannia clavigera kw1407]EFW98594.1 hypothetical protein CMQ_4446 [Grosmannia clavigera kw1407]